MAKRKKSGRNKTKSALYIVGAIVVAVVAIFAASRFANKQLNKGKVTHQECTHYQPAEHIIIIENGKAQTQHVDGVLCDNLTIINKDDVKREMAFGVHSAHTSYDGVSEKLLGANQSFSVTMVESGEFKVHDHLHDTVQATFTVGPRR